MARSRLALFILALAALLIPTATASAQRHDHRQAQHRAVGACSASHAIVRAAAIRRSRDATLCLLNRVRARHGLAPLRLNRKLSRAARRHSRDMVRHRYFAHDSRDGRSPFDRMRATRYVPRNASWWLGENIGWGSGTRSEPAAMVRAWMHSPPHRANILSRNFRDIGIGIAPGAPVGGRGATYTTDFGRHS
ncbi:MAG TPA: CAP domain-containing protein [Conexibacter sp.]|nr:CAP domain-containing protein [Conexibacter sp.]